MKRDYENFAVGEVTNRTVSLLDIWQFLQQEEHPSDARGKKMLAALTQHLRTRDGVCPQTGLDLFQEIYITVSRPRTASSPLCNRALEILQSAGITINPPRLKPNVAKERIMPPVLTL